MPALAWMAARLRPTLLLCCCLPLAAVLALPASAQVFDMEHDRVQMTPLDGPMRFHTGDEPRWSQPALDDSTWPLISSEKSWSDQGYKDYGGFAWYRFKVILPPEHAQLGLYIPGIMTSYQVFVDGKRVGSFGGFPPNATIYDPHHQLVLLPQTQAGEMEIAIRVWHWPRWAMFFGGGMSSAPRIGDATQLKDWMTLEDSNTFRELTVQGYLALLNFLYGIAGFALFLMRRRERLYLWYGLSGFFFGGWSLANCYAAFHTLPALASEAGINSLAVAGFFSFLMFIWMMLGARRTVWIRIGLVSVALNVIVWTLPALHNLPVAVGNLLFVVVTLPMTLGAVVMLIEGVRRGNPDARLLLVPVGLNTLANWVNDALWAILSGGHAWIEPYWAFWNRTFSWPFPFGLYELSIGVLLLAIMGIVVLRFARSRHEEDQLKSELEAARTVQQLLIPEKVPDVPGFRVDTAYKPARHVGGDFFYIRPEEPRSILVVVGDVSGKGLQAALTVNLVIGALRTMPALPPARILAALNRGLIGQMQGGFVTCICALFAENGTVTVANAGHLAPYCNGDEIKLDPGLPLGLIPNADYAETTLHLAPNDTLTFVTDGVPEARNPAGELFGFDRTQKISTQSAQQIAAAAQAHGQEDDITVLTLTFAPAEAPHA